MSSGVMSLHSACLLDACRMLKRRQGVRVWEMAMRDSVHGSISLVLPRHGGSLDEPGPEVPHLSLSKA